MRIYLISLLFGLLFISSCRDTYKQRLTYNHYITNNTNKYIIHIQKIKDIHVKEDSLIFKVNGKCKDSLEWVVTCLNGYANGNSANIINYGSFNIYNLDDTTSLLKWDFFCGGYNCDTTYPQYFHGEFSMSITNENQNEINDIRNYYLNIDDYFLTLFKKDYTMIEKFKEYYKK